MSAKQHAHGELIAIRNPPDEHFIGRSLGRRCLCKHCGHPSHTGARHGHGVIPFNHVPPNKLAQGAKVACFSPVNRPSKFAVLRPQQLSSAVEPMKCSDCADYERVASIPVTLRTTN